MTVEIIKDWGGILGTLLSVVLTFLLVYKSARMTPREIRQADLDTISKYALLADTTVDQLRDVLNDFKDCRDLVDVLYEGIDSLTTQLKSLDAVPCWKPPPRSPK